MAAMGTWRAEGAVCTAEQGMLPAPLCCSGCSTCPRLQRQRCLWNRRDLWVRVCIFRVYVCHVHSDALLFCACMFSIRTWRLPAGMG